MASRLDPSFDSGCAGSRTGPRGHRIVDIGHLAASALAALGAWHSARASRLYFYLLGVWYSIDVITYFFSHLHTLSLARNFAINLPHILIFIAAFWIAAKVGVQTKEA